MHSRREGSQTPPMHSLGRRLELDEAHCDSTRPPWLDEAHPPVARGWSSSSPAAAVPESSSSLGHHATGLLLPHRVPVSSSSPADRLRVALCLSLLEMTLNTFFFHYCAGYAKGHLPLQNAVLLELALCVVHMHMLYDISDLNYRLSTVTDIFLPVLLHFRISISFWWFSFLAFPFSFLNKYKNKNGWGVSPTIFIPKSRYLRIFIALWIGNVVIMQAYKAAVFLMHELNELTPWLAGNLRVSSTLNCEQTISCVLLFLVTAPSANTHNRGFALLPTRTSLFILLFRFLYKII